MIFKLIYNFSILITLIVLSGVVDKFASRRSFTGKILQGILFGGTALIGMLYPYQLSEGLIFDGRSIVISLATLYFGPVTGFITVLFSGIYRLYIGGSGVYMGVSVILSSFFIGWIFHHLRKKEKISILLHWHLLFFGFVVHLVMIMLITTLPSNHRSTTFQQLGLIILVFYPVITLIMGIILNDQEQNQKMLVELTKSEKYLNTIFRSIGDALISLNEHKKITSINHAAEKLLNVDLPSARGQHIDQFMSLSRNNHSISEYFPKDTEYTVFHPIDVKIHRGGIARLSGMISTIKDEDNIERGWVLSLRDVMQEQEYQTRLKAWDESYKGLFNSILSAVYIQNEKGEFLDVNQAAVKLYGYPYERFIGNTPEFLSAPGLNNLDDLARYIKEAFHGNSVQFEFWGKKASGEIFPKEVFLFPTQYFGQQAIVAISNDITQRKEAEKNLRLSEARYKYLFESSPLGMILEDLNGTIISVNSVFCRDYGYEPIELVGKNIRVLANSENKALVKQNIDKIIQYGSLNSQIKATAKNGQEIDIELIESLIDLPDGRKGILSISKNITAQVAAEKARRESELKTNAIIQALPDLIFVNNRQGIFVEASFSSKKK
jgi:PAS domain S-box-containing protein